MTSFKTEGTCYCFRKG